MVGHAVTAHAVTFSGANSNITYTGRTQQHPNQYSVDGQSVDMGWTGGEARIRFTNSSSIRITFRGRDATVPPNSQNTDLLYFLDGQQLRRESVGADWGGNTLITNNLSLGEHNLTVRRDGDAFALLLMEGIILDDGATLLQAPSVNSARKIEFYGDSVTEQCCTIKLANSTDNGDTWGGSNYYDYAALTGRNFGADTRLIAKGGAGMSTGFFFDNMRSMWDKASAGAGYSQYQGFASWQADVVVIATGQNDQYQYDPATDWYGTLTQRYLAQVQDLRRVYPNAWIICMNTTMTDPNFLNGVFSAVRNLGDPKVVTRTFPQQPHGGHPNGNDHIAMANQLTQWIKDLNGWSGTAPAPTPTPAPVAAGTFTTSFENGGDPLPTWNDSPDTDYTAGATNVSGFVAGVGPECGVRSNGDWGTINANSGSSMLMAAGTAGNASGANFCYFKVFNLSGAPVTIASNTTLSYWINPVQDGGRYVALDFHCTDGTTLRDSGLTDQNGKSLHPNAGHGGGIVLGGWSQITANLSSLAGKNIDRVWVAYDRANTTGQFRAYLDDIRIGPGDPSNLAAQ